MDVETFVRQCWSDHASDPRGVADRLGSSLDLVDTPDRLARFAGLLTHVYGEHLGEWSAGAAELDKLGQVWAAKSGSPAGRPIELGIATLRYGAGQRDALDGLSAQDRAAALANAASALAGRNEPERAVAAYDHALSALEGEGSVDARTLKALAAGGNNLAVALERIENRTPRQTEAMLRAAEAALRYWQQAGTWVEEQIAFYRLARSQLQAGRPPAALQSAQQCLKICEAHTAPPVDQFFAHAVTALAHRAAGNSALFKAHKRSAFSYLETLPDDEKASCEADRRELESYSADE